MTVAPFGRSAFWRIEADHDVGEGPLRPDEVARVRLALAKLLHDLLGFIAPLGAIPLDLPTVAQLFRRIKVDLDVKAVAHPLGRKAQKALGDDEVARNKVLWSAQGAVAVIVDRLQNGLSRPQQAEMLLKDINIVAVGMEGGDPGLRPFLPVVPVIVIRTEVRDPVPAQDVSNPFRDGGLAGGAVTHHA